MKLEYTDAGGNLFRLREPLPGDQNSIALALADWPGESYGLVHGVRDVDVWRRENARVPIPLPAPDPVVLSMIFTRTPPSGDEAFIGLVRFGFWFYHCEIINEAIVPSERGKGYSSILHEMQFRLIPIMQPQSVSIRVLESAPAITNYFDTAFTQATKSDGGTGEASGQPITKYEYEMPAYEARKADPNVKDRIIEDSVIARVDPVKPPTLEDLAPPVEKAKREWIAAGNKPEDFKYSPKG